MTPGAAVKPRVLCVDDEPQVVAGLSLNLRRVFTLFTATSGAEALALLAREPGIAVITTDMRMPGMDGLAFLAQARLVAPEAIRILLSGDADADDVQAGLKEGLLFQVLAKPCPIATLLAAITTAADRHTLNSAGPTPTD